MAEQKKQTEEKPEEKEERKEEKAKREEGKKESREAITRGENIPISKKHAFAICKFIKNKKPEDAINLLELIKKKKVAVPFAKGMPHRKGMAGGRYPAKASSYIIKMLHEVVANAGVKGLDTSSLIISAKADKGITSPRPGRRRRVFKRTHITITAIEKVKEKAKKEEEKEEKKAEESKQGEEKKE